MIKEETITRYDELEIDKKYQGGMSTTEICRLNLEIKYLLLLIQEIYIDMSIDRIDSNIGYEEGNIQWVDKRINMMKGSLSNEEFVELCTKVAEYNKKKN